MKKNICIYTLIDSVDTTKWQFFNGFIIVCDKWHDLPAVGIKGMTFPQMFCSMSGI